MQRFTFSLLMLLFAISTRAQRFPVGIISLQDTVKVAQAGLVSSMTSNVENGVQMSGFINISTERIHGLQLGAFANMTKNMEKGVQMSGLLNVASGETRGLQMGAVNVADSLNGTQIGILNMANIHHKGWQVGILNITNDTMPHKIGLVNINPNTRIDYMLYGGTSTKINMAMRFRNRSTYNIIGGGTHYMGLNKKFSGSLFYRIGQFLPLSPKWTISGDLGFYHIETFEDNKDGNDNNDKPERLFSIQARVNADYQINKRLSAFASVGWGDTRYYHKARRYRNRPLFEIGVAWHPQRLGKLILTDDMIKEEKHYEALDDSLMAYGLGKKHYWWALGQVTAVNVGVHLFDRFALDADFAQTTMHTWRKNFKNGFVWDNDQFSTNLFMHPYHGNLYFNSARSQGLSFWESAPMAMLGSLEWEFLGEIEPPAINDLIATTMGGICIGEIMNRTSRIFLNDSKRGWGRFWREALATLFNPMGELKRFATGDAWRVRHDHYLYHDYSKFPIDLSITAGERYLADNGAIFRGEHNPFINLYLDYGDPVNESGHNKPYDYFNADITFGLSGNQPIINRFHLVGRLWSTLTVSRNDVRAEFGVYQHFDYLDSKPVKDGSSQTPYRISEAAAFGPGIIIQLSTNSVLTKLEQRTFLNGILLGGTKSDYYSFIDRDYNMGSGFSIKSKTHMEFGNVARLILHAQYYHIFTWKGYEKKDLTDLDPLHLNSQGDKSNAALLVINPIIEVDVKGPWSICLSSSYYIRNTHYRYYPRVHTKTFETKLGLTCHF